MFAQPFSNQSASKHYPLQHYQLKRELTAKTSKLNGKRIFLAQDTRRQAKVVLKVVQLDQAVHVTDQWMELKLFERETQILQSLDHPAIPGYRDAFEVDIKGVHSFVLVQDYLEADSLESIIQSGKRFSVEEVLTIAEKLLTILIYLHQQTPPVIHRDIKPSNILISEALDENDQPKNNDDLAIYLIDFGSIHTEQTKETGTITIVGSYGYIPLEQFAGQATPASDLYSLGMTLLHVITGIHPADMDQIAGKVQLSQLTLPTDLITWLEKMTSPRLDQRFDSAEAALAALQSKASKQPDHPYKHLKPEGTNIVLTREGDRLQITYELERAVDFSLRSLIRDCWPTLNFMTVVFGCNFWPLAALGTVLLVLLFQLPWLSFPFVFVLLVISYIHVTVLSILNKDEMAGFFWRLLGKKVSVSRKFIEIDRQQGLFIGTYRQENPSENQSIDRSTIRCETLVLRLEALDLLAYSPGYTFNSQTQDRWMITQHDGSARPQLSLHSGLRTFAIGHEKFSPAEFWWLGQEISDFLGLELKTIYPMPIVTLTGKPHF